MTRVYKDNVIVDDKDNPIGRMQLPEALESGAILRVARALVFDPSGQLLLQQRGGNVLAPYKWNDSTSGHVDYDEDYLDCAVRELEEEIGLTVNPDELQEVDYFSAVEVHEKEIKRFHKVFRLNVPQQTEVVADPEEVEAIAWRSLDEVYRDVVADPTKYTQGFRLVLTRYYDRFSSPAGPQ